MDEMYKGKSDLGAVHLWREDLPEEIKVVLKKYDDVFPKDLPNTGGRTTQGLPKETLVTGQVRRHKNYN